jgi:alpha,alpha-trehalose phosphorylase
MDLADVGGNVKDGVHIASMGGTWMAAVYGVAGLRDWDGRISFMPRLPEKACRLSFKLTIQNRLLEFDILQESVTYLLIEGDDLTIGHYDEEIHLTRETPVKRELVFTLE